MAQPYRGNARRGRGVVIGVTLAGLLGCSLNRLYREGTPFAEQVNQTAVPRHDLHGSRDARLGFLLVTTGYCSRGHQAGAQPAAPAPNGWLALAKRTPVYYGWVVFAIAFIDQLRRQTCHVRGDSFCLCSSHDHPLRMVQGIVRRSVSAWGDCARWPSCRGRKVSRPIRIRGGNRSRVCYSRLFAIALAFVGQVWAFYLVYVPGRIVFSSLLEIGPSTVVSNWFIRRRPTSLALLSISQGIGLAVMPLVAPVDYRRLELADGMGSASACIRWPSASFLHCCSWPGDRRTWGCKPTRGRMIRNVNEVPLPGAGPRRWGPCRGQLYGTPSVTDQGILGLGDICRRKFHGTKRGSVLHLASHYMDQGLPGSEAALTISSFANGPDYHFVPLVQDDVMVAGENPPRYGGVLAGGPAPWRWPLPPRWKPDSWPRAHRHGRQRGYAVVEADLR